MAQEQYQRQDPQVAQTQVTQGTALSEVAADTHALNQTFFNQDLQNKTYQASLQGADAGMRGLTPGFNLDNPQTQAEQTYAKSYVNSFTQGEQKKLNDQNTLSVARIQQSDDPQDQYDKEKNLLL